MLLRAAFARGEALMTRKFKLAIFFLLSLLSFAYLAFVPHYWLYISHRGGTDMFLIPQGQEIILSYVHSLEKTPVRDLFFLQENRICLYEEMVKSHNAGLPTLHPYPGSLIKTKDWLIFRGGRRHWSSIYCRVGNAEIGKNVLTIGDKDYQLYALYPGETVCLSVVLKPIL